MAEAGFTISDGIRIFMRYRRIFLVCAALFCIASLQIMQRVMVKKYTASAMFERRSDVLVEQGNDKGTESFDSLKRTLEQDLVDNSAMEQLIDDLEIDGLIKPLPRNLGGKGLTAAGEREKQKLIRQIKDGIEVAFTVRSANVDYVMVSYTDETPQMAAKVPNELIKIYINNTSQKVRRRLTESYYYTNERYQEAEKRFKQCQIQRDKFESEYSGITIGSPIVILQQIQQAKADSARLDEQLILARKKYARLMELRERQEKGDPNPSEVVKGPNPEIALLDKELTEYRYQLEKAITLEHMTEEHPAVKSLRSSIQLVEERIKRIPKMIVLQEVYASGAGIQALAAEVASAQAEVESVDSQLNFARAKVTGFEKMQRDFVRAKQDYSQIMELWMAAQRDFRYWEQEKKQVEAILSAEVANRRITMDELRKATEPLDPSAPKLQMIYIYAFVGGVAFAAGVIFLLFKLNTTITTPEDAVRQFELPVYGVISEIVTPVTRHRRKFTAIFIEPIVAIVLIMGIAISVYSTRLWVKDPENYDRFNAAPVEFMMNKVESVIGK